MPRARSSDFSRLEPLLLLGAIVLILYFARELLIPFAFALTLTFLLAPAVVRLEALRVPRVGAVALTGALAFAAILSVGYVVAHQLMNVAESLPAYRLNIQRRMATVHSPAEQSIEKALAAAEGIGEDLSPGPRNQPRPNSILLEVPPSEAQPVRIVDPKSSQLQSNAEFLLQILRPIGALGVVIVFTIYLLMKREDLRRRILLLAGISRISLMTDALQDAATRISQYLVMQLAVNAAYGILFGCGLYLIGIPDATLWGALAGMLRIIPYVGTAAGLIFPLVISVAVFPAWGHPLAVVALFLSLELSATNFVEPWLYSSRTGISSLALLTMAIFWALIWGWPGLILSTPLTVCFVVLGRYVPQMSFLHTLLGADAELSPEALFYERLLALDQNEAREVANKFLATNSLVSLYDEIFIPSLRLVEQDRHAGTLDEGRSNFFFLSIGELIAELTSYRHIEGSSEPLPPVGPLALESSKGKYRRLISLLKRRAESPNLVTLDPGSWISADSTESRSDTRNHAGANASPASATEPLSASEESEIAESGFAVICISASDQADELTSHMLAQLMERDGHPTLLLSAASTSSEVLDGLALEPNTVVFISALPPFAFSQARATCQRVRSHLPRNRIVIGFWEKPEDAAQPAGQPADPAAERFGSGRPTLVVNTLAQALAQVEFWRQQPSPQPVNSV